MFYNYLIDNFIYILVYQLKEVKAYMSLISIFFTVGIILIIIFIFGNYFKKYFNYIVYKSWKIPHELTAADKKMAEWDIERAEIQREIFIIETLLKFLPASILTILISILYIGDQEITIFGFQSVFMLGAIIIALTIFISFLLWRSSELYKILYPIIREIDYLKEVSTDEKIKAYKQQIQKVEKEKLVIEKEKDTIKKEKEEIEKQLEFQKELEKQRKLERERKEFEYIKEIDERISELKVDSINSQRNSALIFKTLCRDEIILETENEILLNKIKEYLSLISFKMNNEILDIIVEAFHILIMNSRKQYYFNMAKDDLYQLIKDFVIDIGNLGRLYKIEIHHIFCNIVKTEDIELALQPFQYFDRGKHPLDQYRSHFVHSLLVNNNKVEVLKKIVDILDRGIDHSDNYKDLQEYIASVSIINQSFIPRCKREEQ